MSRKRYTKRQDIFVLPDTFWCKYPSLDTVWCSTDRNRLEMFLFQDDFAFLNFFCFWKVHKKIFDGYRDHNGTSK